MKLEQAMFIVYLFFELRERGLWGYYFGKGVGVEI